MNKQSNINFIKTSAIALIILGQVSIGFADSNNVNHQAIPGTSILSTTPNPQTPSLEKSLSAGITAAVDSALGVTPNTGTTTGKSNKCPPGQAKKGNCFCPPGQAKKGNC